MGDGTYVIDVIDVTDVTDDEICEWATLRMKKGRFARCEAAFVTKFNL